MLEIGTTANIDFNYVIGMLRVLDKLGMIPAGYISESQGMGQF